MKKLTTLLLILTSLWISAQESPRIILTPLQSNWTGLALGLGSGLVSFHLIKPNNRAARATISFGIGLAAPLVTAFILKNRDLAWGGTVGSFCLTVPIVNNYNSKNHRHEYNR